MDDPRTPSTYDVSSSKRSTIGSVMKKIVTSSEYNHIVSTFVISLTYPVPIPDEEKKIN